MHVVRLSESPALKIVDYRCRAGPQDAPFAEHYGSSCLAFVRRGSFGCSALGRSHELVPGSVLVGRAGDEYVCTHPHHTGGDECLSLHFSPELTEELAHPDAPWPSGSAPPLAELGVLGVLAQAAAEGRTGLGIDEAALLFAARFAELRAWRSRESVRPHARDRRRAVRAALWISAAPPACRRACFARLPAAIARFPRTHGPAGLRPPSCGADREWVGTAHRMR